jgi:hypothetical protein
MSSIVQTPDGFLAVGTASDDSGVVWTSTDGVAWTRLDLGAAFAGALVAGANQIGGRIVVFGTTEAGKLIAASGLR